VPLNERDYMKFTDEERRIFFGGGFAGPSARTSEKGAGPFGSVEGPMRSSPQPYLLQTIDHPVLWIVLVIAVGAVWLWLSGDPTIRGLIASF
jgi:hypothetical protein